jgi:hypothetical protein
MWRSGGDILRIFLNSADFVREGRLVRIGHVVFAKARRSLLSGKPVPRQPLEVLVAETFRHLNIETSVGQPEQEYASGRSTQVPILATFNTGQRRISRKLMLGKRSIRYVS